MKKFSHAVLSSVAVLSLLTSCGQDSTSSKGSSAADNTTSVGDVVQETAPVDGSNIVGHYQAKFTTLNPQVNGTIPGSANFFRKDDRIFAYVRLFAGGVKAWHMQHVYTGGRCPTASDDKNGDGFIDIAEAEGVLGKIIIPLDSDVSTQNSGRRFFPLGDLSGYYHYERVTSFRRFLNDLQSADPDPADDVVKLPPGEGLQITGKTVLIQGVIETIDLPETVGTKGRFRPFQTLPIACGVFEKVEKTPGEAYMDNGAPEPVAEVEEGQDRPAEDTPTSDGSTGGSTGGSTNETNDSDDGDGPVSDGEGRVSTGRTGETGNEGPLPPRDYGEDEDEDEDEEEGTPDEDAGTGTGSSSSSSSSSSTSSSSSSSSSRSSSSSSSSSSGGTSEITGN